MSPATRAVALDLGTTRVKAGVLDVAGRLEIRASLPAPPRAVNGEEVTSDPAHWERVARAALEAALELLPTERPGAETPPLGISCQRSSFLLWEAQTGRPRTPLISWQDRRAAAWCRAHAEAQHWIQPLTGLPLSAHYAGPKLAALLETHPDWHAELASGRLLFGTLESFLIRCWSPDAVHLTDLSMAARTLLADPRMATWSPRLLELFGVPEAALPRLAPTADRPEVLVGGVRCAASVADQAASALALFSPACDELLVNLGTGGFVLRGTGARLQPRPGYLAGPLRGGGSPLFALEGTINGGAGEADAQALGPTELPERDPAPEALCFPDGAGAGAPRWNPAARFALSEAATSLPPPDRRRVVLEGLVFRIREISDDLQTDARAGRVLLSGGLAREPFLGAALAACLERDIEVVADAETSLFGAACLAAGFDAVPIGTHVVAPGPRGHWLRDKYDRWRSWVEGVLPRDVAGRA